MKIVVDKVVWRSEFMKGIVEYRISRFDDGQTMPTWHAEVTFRNGKLDAFTHDGAGEEAKRWFEQMKKAADVSAAIGILDPMEEALGIGEGGPVSQTKSAEWDKLEYTVGAMPGQTF